MVMLAGMTTRNSLEHSSGQAQTKSRATETGIAKILLGSTEIFFRSPLFWVGP